MTIKEVEANNEARHDLLILVKAFSPSYKAEFLAAVTRVAESMSKDADKELLEFRIEEKAQMLTHTNWLGEQKHNERIFSRALEIIRAQQPQKEQKRRKPTRKKTVLS